MKNNRALYSFVLLALLHVCSMNAEPIITFFMYRYPIEQDAKAVKKMGNKLEKLGKIAKYTHEGLAHGTIIAGIFSTYAGYITTSDINGQTAFPRKQEQKTINMLVTNQITPIVMVGNTLAHWKLEEGTPARMYSLALKQDEKTNLHFWQTQKVDLPKEDIIPLDTIIILAKPKNIYLPEGATLSAESPNLVLPNVYVKKGVKIAKNALYIMNIMRYFGPVNYLYQQKPTNYLRAIH